MTKEIISFQELAVDLTAAMERDKLNALLNCAPREAWLKKHPLVKVKENGVSVALKYMPIGNVRTLMRAIFQRTRREIISCGQVANSVQAIVRVHYKDPLTNEWDWQDGVGAVPLQTDAGESAAALLSIKNNAVQLASPAAVSYAFKNACEEIGNIFGANLQKANLIEFVGLYDTEAPVEKVNNNIGEEITTSF